MFQSGRWQVTVYPLSAGMPAIPGFETILDVWLRKRGDRALPARSDIELWDLGRWAGWVNFSVHRPEGPVFTLYGSENSRLFGADLTGRNLCDHVDAEHRAEMTAFYAGLAERVAIGHICGQSIMRDMQWLPVETLVLPLGDDHVSVGRFMHVIRATARRSLP